MGQIDFKALLSIFLLLAVFSLVPALVYAGDGGGSEVSISNGILTVYIENETGYDGVGTYTICTGPYHPVPDQDVLQFGVDGDAWTSYNTVHILNETIGVKKDYITESDTVNINSCTGFSLCILDNVSPQIELTQTRMVIRWSTPEGLNVTQDIEVLGSNWMDTYVRITMTVRNTNNTYFYNVGIRYLWDLKVAWNDGSWLRAVNPTSGWLNSEHIWSQPNFKYWEATDNPADPTLIVCGSITEPSMLSPSRPDNFIFGAWGPSGLYNNSWCYTINPSRQIADTNLDSAVAYYWGPTTLKPDEKISVTAYIWVLPPRPVGGFIVDSAYALDSDGLTLANLWPILVVSCVLFGFAAHRAFRRFRLILQRRVLG
ncbi:MAG: hypothetical protein QXT26_07645 [Thermoproteota archaeon]